MPENVPVPATSGPESVLVPATSGPETEQNQQPLSGGCAGGRAEEGEWLQIAAPCNPIDGPCKDCTSGPTAETLLAAFERHPTACVRKASDCLPGARRLRIVWKSHTFVIHAFIRTVRTLIRKCMRSYVHTLAHSYVCAFLVSSLLVIFMLRSTMVTELHDCVSALCIAGPLRSASLCAFGLQRDGTVQKR